MFYKIKFKQHEPITIYAVSRTDAMRKAAIKTRSTGSTKTQQFKNITSAKQIK